MINLCFVKCACSVMELIGLFMRVYDFNSQSLQSRQQSAHLLEVIGRCQFLKCVKTKGEMCVSRNPTAMLSKDSCCEYDIMWQTFYVLQYECSMHKIWPVKLQGNFMVHSAIQELVSWVG